MDEAVPAFDSHALIARLRAEDPDALTEAYQRVFGSEPGRFVLAHILATLGVGRVQGPELTSEQRHYAAGRNDAGLTVMSLAGFDPSSAAVMVLTGKLEGRHDEHSAQPEGFADAHPQLDD